MATGISFDGNSLQTFDGSHGIITQDIEHAGKNTKQATTYALSHANKSTIPFVVYPNKPINVTGVIIGTDIADCDSEIDTFNGYLTTKDGNLDIDYNSGTRRYICTATAIDTDRPGGLAWANFTVTFTATRPFGQNTSTSTALSDTGRTSGIYNDDYTFIGSAPVQWPTYTYTLNSVTDGTGAQIVIGNNATGQQLTINRNWANGDVLVIDVSNRTVQVNSDAVDFSGAFPEFAPGAQTLTYSDTFTARNFDISVVYYPLYL